jgi:5,10-methylenetetrahydrofolate reductase
MVENFINKLQSDGSFLTLEVTPAHSANFTNIIEKIKKLKLQDMVDGFSTTDNPLARLKYNSMFSALRLQQEFKKPCITTMTMRDRNKIALQSDMLGMNEQDLRVILALTGDPARISDQPNAKAVNEGRSTLLLDMIRCFNSGIDYSGKPFKDAPKTIYPFAVTNAAAKNSKTIYKNILTKLRHGAMAIITQPVYDIQNAKELIRLFEEAKKEIKYFSSEPILILGFFPATKLRTAQFLSSHVPGVSVPDYWMKELSKAKEVGEEQEVKKGMELSINAFKSIYEIHPKIHFMAANHFDLVKEILKISL